MIRVDNDKGIEPLNLKAKSEISDMFKYLAEAAGKEYNAYYALLRAEGITLGKTLLKDTTTGLYGSINLLRAYTVNGEGTGVFLFSYLTFFPIPKSDATAYRIVLPIDGPLTEEKMRLSVKGLLQRMTIVALTDEQIKAIENAQSIQIPEGAL